MALRSGHGSGAGQPRIEVLPADELPAGVAGPERQKITVLRDAGGRVRDSRSARELARRGGLAKAGTTRLASGLGLTGALADERFRPYRGVAEAFRRAQISRLAGVVGGGECGPAPSSIIASAAWQLAASRYAYEVLGDVQLGSRLANDSRQNLLAAHELCAREAKAKAENDTPAPWLEADGEAAE